MDVMLSALIVLAIPAIAFVIILFMAGLGGVAPKPSNTRPTHAGGSKYMRGYK